MKRGQKYPAAKHAQGELSIGPLGDARRVAGFALTPSESPLRLTSLCKNFPLAALIKVFSQVFRPDEQSTSQLLSEVVARLSESGLALVVVAGFPGLLRSQAAPLVRESWRGVQIERVGMRVSAKKNLLVRAAAYGSYSLAALWRLVRAPRGSRVFVVTNPPFLPVLAAWCCAVRGHRLKVMLQDIYPEGLVAVGRLRRTGVVSRLWHGLNRRAFRRADELWVLGRDMAELVQSHYGVPPGKIRLVPHWSPVEFASMCAAEQTNLFRELELEGKFVVQYSGNMGLWHDLASVVRAAELLQADPRVVFLLIGQGRERVPAERLAHELGLKNIRWLPYQPKERLEDSLSCCHAALISQRAGLEGVAVPCKLYGILASGRAVVAQVPAASEVARVVAEERCGCVVAPGDAQGLADAIAALVRDPETTARMGARSRAAYLAKYTIEAGTRAFAAGFAQW